MHAEVTPGACGEEEEDDEEAMAAMSSPLYLTLNSPLRGSARKKRMYREDRSSPAPCVERRNSWRKDPV